MKLDNKSLKSILPNTCEFSGNIGLSFSNIQSAYESKTNEITWIKEGITNETEIINNVSATGIICSPKTKKLYNGDLNGNLFILHPNPKLIFQILTKFMYNLKYEKQNGPQIHPTAIIDPKCVLGENILVGAYCVIGACEIGDNVVIHDHVKIYDCVKIDNGCLIREFCSIGGEGFGFIKNLDGKNERIPHIGEVIIENDVCIFPFSNVDRGTLGKTIIKSHTVIDHYVHVGHNSKTGENNIIAAGTVLAGGSEIKNNCFIGVNTLLKEKQIIGSNVLTGMGTVVVKDIPDNEIWIGNPGRFFKKNTV
jgi:UDP-3-O-[3-hydroxymyristoyl] glucosamine N-acyltransferase